MKRECPTAVRPVQVESPSQQRHLPLVDLLVDTRSELFEFAIRSGLKVLDAMLELEEDRTAICGRAMRIIPSGWHRAARSSAKWCLADARWPFGGRTCYVHSGGVGSREAASVVSPRLPSAALNRFTIARRSRRVGSSRH